MQKTTTAGYTVERIDASCANSYADVVRKFERAVPPIDMTAVKKLVASRADASAIETQVARMAGDLGFMTMATLEQGPLVTLLGKPKKMITYLIGNPLLANRMYEQHPAIGLYAPLRVAIYEDDRGVTRFTYEKPSTSLAQFEQEQVRSVARLLDEKLATLTGLLSGV